MDAFFIRNAVLDITSALAAYGFIVNTIAADGASENRSANKMLATVTAREAFGQDTPQQLADRLPLDIIVAFYHPILTWLLIFIGGDMPHTIRKFVNAAECTGKPTSKREMTFKGKLIDLRMLHDLWKTTGDATGLCGVRQYHFSTDHFVKNSFSCMKVNLAVQITSQTMITMKMQMAWNSWA
jgi:hypothetical protein